MAKQTLLPKMETKSYNEVMGTLDLGLRENKLTEIFGSPGTGKSSALVEFASLHPNAHNPMLLYNRSLGGMSS